MAKRVRGSTSRPGQRPRLQRSGAARSTASRPAQPAATAPVAPRPATLTPEEEARAAALEAEIVAQEQASIASSRRVRERPRRAATVDAASRGSIAERASQEYAYVARDVRRIAIIGGGLVGILLGLWAIHTVTGMGPI